MKPYRIIIRLLCAVLICTPLMLAAVIVQAQEGGLNETFDDPSLSGWEHNEGASASPGTRWVCVPSRQLSRHDSESPGAALTG